MKHAQADLQHDVRRGFLWLGSASAVARVLEILKVFVVLWCLSQEQLGEATLAWSVSVVLEALSGLGIGSALVQADDVDERTLASAFWYTLAVATVLVLGVCAAAPLLAQAFGHPELTGMIRVSATKLWFVGAAVVPLSLLNRALSYEKLALVSTLSTLGSGLVTCTLAFAGLGGWAPLLGNTFGGVATMVLAFIVSPYRPRWCFAWQSLRTHAAFGLKLASSGALTQLYRNADYWLVGQWLDVAAVGVYRVAFDLAMAPSVAVFNVIGRAATPAYARLAHDRKALARLFAFTLESLGASLAPVTALIALHAVPVLALEKHGQWALAAPLVPWLCAAAFLRCIHQTFPQLFQALREPWLVLYDALATGLSVCLAIAGMLWLSAATHGALAAAWGWVIAYPLLTLGHVLIAQRRLPLRIGALVHSQRHVLGCVLTLSATRLLVVAFAARAQPAWDLALSLPACLISYLLYARFVARSEWAVRLLPRVPRVQFSA